MKAVVVSELTTEVSGLLVTTLSVPVPSGFNNNVVVVSVVVVM